MRPDKIGDQIRIRVFPFRNLNPIKVTDAIERLENVTGVIFVVGPANIEGSSRVFFGTVDAQYASFEGVGNCSPFIPVTRLGDLYVRGEDLLSTLIVIAVIDSSCQSPS